ncbi:hypothetical protein [Mesorhizobium sp. M1A.F.Ca.IN.020.03.2.1]|uniref:hypothetical protein n=1 Tax=Mesorhizobium sp. M1A.F.Ca.IN.020.03.2.1 TaxID=2496769 RepID=UPI001FE1556A|nr:hypothetical protein [Mesorhizobium sp. M1A.F.Ca.IN.020.03.2.1]
MAMALCHGRDAFPVMAQPDLCPSRACQAIIREKGDERSFRRRYAAISRGPGKEPFFALDDWHVESGIGQKRLGIPAAGIHDHHLERDVLAEHRPDRRDQIGRSPKTYHHDCKFRPVGHQALCSWTRWAGNRRRAAILSR